MLWCLPTISSSRYPTAPRKLSLAVMIVPSSSNWMTACDRFIALTWLCSSRWATSATRGAAARLGAVAVRIALRRVAGWAGLRVLLMGRCLLRGSLVGSRRRVGAVVIGSGEHAADVEDRDHPVVDERDAAGHGSGAAHPGQLGRRADGVP